MPCSDKKMADVGEGRTCGCINDLEFRVLCAVCCRENICINEKEGTQMFNDYLYACKHFIQLEMGNKMNTFSVTDLTNFEPVVVSSLFMQCSL